MNKNSKLFARALIAIAALVAIPDSGQAAAPEYVLTVKPAQRVEAVQTFEVRYPKIKATEWVVFATAAPDVPSQQKVSTKLSPDGHKGVELSELKRPIVWAKVAAGAEHQTQFRYAVTYRATLLERRLTPLPKSKGAPRVKPLTGAEKKWYLANTETFYDYKSKPFQVWLGKRGLRIKDGEGEVAFARRVFLTIADTCAYEARQDNDHHASAVCQSGKSDCGGLSVLFVAALRANGVPARSLVGNWAESAEAGKKVGDIPFTQQHTRAEFFAAGIGWVPVDPSAAFDFKGMREAMLDQCFGYDAGNFLVKQIDYDLTFDTGLFGRQTVPWAWCTAWPVGSGEQTTPTLKDDWKVRQLRDGE
jgi:transglutaminase-like putative cysteine protease